MPRVPQAAFRCEAETRCPKGHEWEGWQCLRWKIRGERYCRQHLKIAQRKGAPTSKD